MSTEAVIALVNAKASEELKNLLENKHLYQHVKINAPEILKQQIDAEKQANLKIYLAEWGTKELPKLRFVLADRSLSLVSKGSSTPHLVLTLVPPNASVFCGKCGRREAFAPVWYSDATNEINKLNLHASKQITLPESFQLFFLVYQCQRCFGTPEAFLIRRTSWGLGLHGRSPIELIQTPAQIPSPELHHYRNAALAFNSGKVLAALFYLRTFIEQFARRITGRTGRATGEEILNDYYETLPLPTKDQMPSLREWYDKLSDALHSANPDSELFETARAQIDKHFDIRRVFNIPENAPPAVNEEPRSEIATSKKAE
jgi:hypothetical protein